MLWHAKVMWKRGWILKPSPREGVSSTLGVGAIIQDNGEIDENVADSIIGGSWNKRLASGVFCDKVTPKVESNLKHCCMGRSVVASQDSHVQKMKIVEMRMLRWMGGWAYLREIWSKWRYLEKSGSGLHVGQDAGGKAEMAKSMSRGVPQDTLVRMYERLMLRLEER